MKLKEALITWTPKWRVNLPAGDKVGIAVERFLPREDTSTRQHKNSWGACNTYVEKLTQKQAAAELMLFFNAVVTRDGVPSEEVHRELSKIDEYREATKAAPV